MLCFQRDIRLLSEEHRPALRAGCMSLKLLQSWRTMASCRYNPGHNLARQLRPGLTVERSCPIRSMIS